jgi:nucleoside-triphosphatase
MARHLFLTGEKGVGKSTLIKKLLITYGRPVGGFFTVKSKAVLSERTSVHLLRAGTDEVPAFENLLFCCGAADKLSAERFNRLGCAALTAGADARLLVMDELGPHETDALDFRAAVIHALNGEIPVLGVLQDADTAFFRQIADHPNVHIVRVTHANRDEMESLLSDYL